MAKFKITNERVNDDGAKEIRVRYGNHFYWVNAAVFAAGLLSRGVDILTLAELGV